MMEKDKTDPRTEYTWQEFFAILYLEEGEIIPDREPQPPHQERESIFPETD
ncbi:MAG: hypothetical protein P1V34_19705 [Alphaproteobacteria bacterium]|nr:hypothetical protein [Alphaproteobacteria bacterium]